MRQQNHRKFRAFVENEEEKNSVEDMDSRLPHSLDSVLPHSLETPWFVAFSHGKWRKLHTFFSAADGQSYVRNIPELHRKHCHLSSYGWLFMEDQETKDCLLINPQSMEKVQLPRLPAENKKFSYVDMHVVLSAPPADQNCVILFIHSLKPFIIYWHKSLENWKKMLYRIDKQSSLDEQDSIAACAVFNRKVYGITLFDGKLVVIDFNPHPQVKILEVAEPFIPFINTSSSRYMVESSGDLFLVFIIYVGYVYAITIEVFKMDFSSMKWVGVDSIGDHAFFLPSQISCSSSTCGVKSDCIYFAEHHDPTLHRFDMVDRSIARDIPCLNISTPYNEPQWFLPSPATKWKSKPRQDFSTEMKTSKYKMNKVDGMIEDESYWSDLPNELLVLLVERLNLVDRFHFGLVCKKFLHLVGTVLRYNGLLLGSPCLLTITNGSKTCTLLNPLNKEEYMLNTPSLPSRVEILFSKDGWLLMLSQVNRSSIFFFNILTKEKINLPDLNPYRRGAFSFTSSPASPDCLVVAINACDNWSCIRTCCRGENFWSEVQFNSGTIFDCRFSNPLFHKGSFYCLADNGLLGVYNPFENTWIIMENTNPEKLGSLRISLFESQGELFRVWAGVYGEFVRVHKLDPLTNQWNEVDSIGDKQLFVGGVSSLCLDAKSKFNGGRIYLQMLTDEKDFVFYSRIGGELNSEGKLYGAKDYLLACWIEPVWTKLSPQELHWSNA